MRTINTRTGRLLPSAVIAAVCGLGAVTEVKVLTALGHVIPLVGDIVAFAPAATADKHTRLIAQRPDRFAACST
jgi:hypothetical protein